MSWRNASKPNGMSWTVPIATWAGALILCGLTQFVPLARAQQVEPSLEGGIAWINTDGPVHLEKLRGKIILLDFWTYCCINCHHVLPDLAMLEKKYNKELVVIGVHTAKFEAEKDTENIRKKVHEYGIKHPVVNDANQVIWQRFGISGWPSLALIDPEGKYQGHVSGEGHGEALDKYIGKLVKEHKAKGTLDDKLPVVFPAEVEKPHKGNLLFPGKVLADAASKTLYISDNGHNRIVVTDLDGNLKETIGNGIPALKDGDYKAASFNRPQGMCLLDGKLYVADTENHAIREIDLAKKDVKTVAGTGRQGYNRKPSGKGTKLDLNSPWDVLPMPGSKILAVAMAGPHQIWKYDTVTGNIGHLAGSGIENIHDGTAGNSAFAQPSGLATDGQHIFVADSEVSGVRAINTSRSHHVSTIVGQGLFEFGDIDGEGSRVRLQHCLGLAYADGKLYIADTYNNKIKVCDPKTRSVQTFLGDGKRGTSDDPPRFHEPGGISVADGKLYIADTNNHLIRVADLATKAVKTLDLKGVTAPRIKKAPSFANAKAIEIPAATAAPGSEITLNVKLSVPEGYKLSQEGSLIYLLSADGPPNPLSTEVSPYGETIEPKSEFSVKVPFAQPMAEGKTVNLKLSVSAFLCLPNSLCTFKNYVLTVPVSFKAGAGTSVAVPATLTLN